MLGEWFAAVLVLMLALYGCVQLIRRVCLWATRCPRAVRCYRLAMPQSDTAMESLFRCLQAQAVWADAYTERTLVLLPPLDGEQQRLLQHLNEQHPAVKIITVEELVALATYKNEE